MQPPKLYNPSNHHITPAYLSDNQYTAAISALVMVNSDVIFIDKADKTFILPTRKRAPADGLWPIGGRRKAGQTATQAAVDALQKEAGLSILDERLIFLQINEYIWNVRTQTPTNFGRHDQHWVYTLEISPDEINHAAKHLDSDEYDVSAGFKRLGRQQLLAAGAKDIIIDYWDAVFG